MNPHQHTVLALLIGIVVIRVIASGRLLSAWQALIQSSNSPVSTPPPAPQITTGGGTGNRPMVQ